MQIIDVYYLDTNLLLVCRFCFARVSRITPQSHGSWRCRASSSYKITTMYVRTRGWHPSNLQGSKIAKIHIQITRQNQSQGHRPEALLHGMGMCPVKDSTIELKVRGHSSPARARRGNFAVHGPEISPWKWLTQREEVGRRYRRRPTQCSTTFMYFEWTYMMKKDSDIRGLFETYPRWKNWKAGRWSRTLAFSKAGMMGRFCALIYLPVSLLSLSLRT